MPKYREREKRPSSNNNKHERRDENNTWPFYHDLDSHRTLSLYVCFFLLFNSFDMSWCFCFVSRKKDVTWNIRFEWNALTTHETSLARRNRIDVYVRFSKKKKSKNIVVMYLLKSHHTASMESQNGLCLKKKKFVLLLSLQKLLVLLLNHFIADTIEYSSRIWVTTVAIFYSA